MDRKKQAQLINEWETKGTSYRNLAVKYKSNSSTVHRMIKRHKKNQEEEQLKALAKQTEDMPDDVEALKKELRKALLKIELQDLMIDISSKELGVDLRKKHGTRQSK
jgi:Mor family transcriptional regulator